MITDKNLVVQNVSILRDDRVFKTFFKQNKKMVKIGCRCSKRNIIIQ